MHLKQETYKVSPDDPRGHNRAKVSCRACLERYIISLLLNDERNDLSGLDVNETHHCGVILSLCLLFWDIASTEYSGLN